MDENPLYTWSPPEYDLSRAPALDDTLALAVDAEYPQNFARITKWCPDGSVYLSQCENQSFQLGSSKTIVASETEPVPKTRVFHQPAPIVDFAWYPMATVMQPATFCYVASVRECPVKLYDALDGRLRASYPIIDHRERFIAPQSLAFNLSAQKLYCGFEDAIEIFDFGTPGEGVRLPTTPSKKSKDGLKGIISALAFCPSYESDVFAAGSLNANNNNIVLFSESQGNVPLMFLDAGVRAGITQLQFNPLRPHLLYASFRRDSRILCWDIRNGAAPLQILLPATSASAADDEDEDSTTQKRRFDIDAGGKRLAVGRQNGSISLYDLASSESGDASSFIEEEYSTPILTEPQLAFAAHKDSIGSVAFHPTTARLLSAAGSRHFVGSDDGDEDDVVESDSSDSSSDPNLDSEAGEQVVSILVPRTKKQPVVQDNSLKLWNF